MIELDGVGPVDNRPSTDNLYHFVQKKNCDMWHVTRDTWHVTYDMFGGVNILSKFQLPSSYRLGFMMLWRSGGKGCMNELMNDKAIYRTAPATPGLLITSYAVILTASVERFGVSRMRDFKTLFFSIECIFSSH